MRLFFRVSSVVCCVFACASSACSGSDSSPGGGDQDSSPPIDSARGDAGIDTTASIDSTTNDSSTSDSSASDSTPTSDSSSSDSGSDVPGDSSGGSTLAPVCGTDGVTYWNAATAAAAGATVASDGPCGSTAHHCGGSLASKCTSTQTCVRESSTTCPLPDIGGQCWQFATGITCPSSDPPSYHDCASGVCESFCTALTSGHAFYKSSTCP